MHVLIVAEKPSVAKALELAFRQQYSLRFQKRRGVSPYNPIYKATISQQEISFQIENQTFSLGPNSILTVSSVLGHILNYEYPPPYDKKSDWTKTDPEQMIGLSSRLVPSNSSLVRQIEQLSAQVNVLSKSDLLTKKDREIAAKWFEHVDYIYTVMSREENALLGSFSQSIMNALMELESLTHIIPVSSKTGEGIDDLFAYLQRIFAGGEEEFVDVGPFRADEAWY